jgi:hypothetical protein
VYIVVRADLPGPHRAVQACHAALAATLAFGEPDATHPNLVLCTAESEEALAGLFNRLLEAGVRCCAWYEDDLGGQLTAIATGLLRGKERALLRGLPLLR